MRIHQLAAVRTIGLTSLLLILALGYSGFAQTPAPPPTLAPPLISLAEARVIIDGAVAFTRDQNLSMARRRSKPIGVRLNGDGFRSQFAAKLAGEKALRDLLDGLAQE